jgi:hypothetical protein
MVIFGRRARKSILHDLLLMRTVTRAPSAGDLMTIARAQLVDVSLARWYHCVTRCVRRAFLLGEGDLNRKD